MVLKNETVISWKYRPNRLYQRKTWELIKEPPNPKDTLLNFEVADHRHEYDSLSLSASLDIHD